MTADMYDPHKSVRRTDVETSRDAAKSMGASAARHHQLILAALKDCRRPMAAEEVSAWIGDPLIDRVVVCRRFCELQRAGLIERSEGEKHVNSTGKKAFRWWLKGDPAPAEPAPAVVGEGPLF